MSSSPLMSIGQTAMFANYAALQTTSNNISNANTVGYSRQETQFATARGQFTGAGFFGKGVSVTSIKRSYDQFLTTQAAGTSSLAAADSARLGQLNQLENIFATGDSGIGASAGNLLNAFVDVANNPADASSRQVVISQTKELASRFRAASDQLSVLQNGLTQDVRSSVATVNGLTKQIASLNLQISGLKGTGQPPNDLLDARDQLVAQVSKYVGVTTIPAEDGSLGVFVGGGQSIVLGASAVELKAVPDAFDPSKIQLALADGSGYRELPQDGLGGGAIAGLLAFQNDDLTTARNLLGQMAAAVSSSLNQQQALGLDLGQPPHAGTPLFSVGAPRTLASLNNNGDAEIGITISDATHVQASDYAMSYDGANYSLTRVSDHEPAIGSPFSDAQLAAGIQVDGMTIQLASGTAQVGDRFLLQPVAVAAQAMTATLADPRGLAAASPFTSTLGAANTGTATVASLGAVDPAYDGSLTADISFTSDTGDYHWTLSDGSSGDATWTAGTPIALNGFALALNGVPRLNDTITVKPTLATAGNNGNALSFFNLGTAAIVGAVTRSDGTEVAGHSVTDAYASALSNIGVRVQTAKSASTISTAVATDAETARANKAGVNLDEEAARLIQFQQSYQAAAKILQVAQQVFDTLLQTAAG